MERSSREIADFRHGGARSNDGAGSVALLTIVATSGVQSGLVMAVFVANLERALGLTAVEAAFVVSAGLGGSALGTLIAAFAIRRLARSRPTALLLAGTTVLELLCALTTRFELLLIARLLVGLAGGLTIGISYSLMAQRRAPDRAFAIMLFSQIAFGGVGTFAIPLLVGAFGLGAMFVAFALLPAAGLLLLRHFPASQSLKAEDVTASARTAALTNVVAVLGVCFYQLTRSLVAAHLVGFGVSLALPRATVTGGIAAATILGAGGAVLSAGLGLRIGRRGPLAAGTAAAVAAMALLIGVSAAGFGAVPPTLAWAGVLTLLTVADAFVLPYYFGVCAAAGATGQMAVWGGFLSKIGLSVGPVLGAYMLAAGSYPAWLATGIVVTGLAGVCSVAAAAAIARRVP